MKIDLEKIINEFDYKIIDNLCEIHNIKWDKSYLYFRHVPNEYLNLFDDMLSYLSNKFNIEYNKFNIEYNKFNIEYNKFNIDEKYLIKIDHKISSLRYYNIEETYYNYVILCNYNYIQDKLHIEYLNENYNENILFFMLYYIIKNHAKISRLGGSHIINFYENIFNNIVEERDKIFTKFYKKLNGILLSNDPVVIIENNEYNLKILKNYDITFDNAKIIKHIN